MDKNNGLEQEWKNYKIRSIFASPLIWGSLIFTISIVVYLEFAEPFFAKESELVTKVDKKLAETIQKIENQKSNEGVEFKEASLEGEKNRDSELVTKVNNKLTQTIKEIEEKKLNESVDVKKEPIVTQEQNETNIITVKKEVIFTPDLSYELRLIKKNNKE